MSGQKTELPSGTNFKRPYVRPTLKARGRLQTLTGKVIISDADIT